MIRIESLYKRFGKLTALNDVTLKLEEDNAFALLGPNASGKSTLIKCILNLVKPDEGAIHIDGENIRNSWEYREKIGYMPQIGNYPGNMKISQLFRMMKDIRKGSVKHYDEELYQAFEMPRIEHKYFNTLSGGTTQKVSACLAFMFDPPILILDEPTAGLDPLSTEILKEKVLQEKQKGKLILITSHILSDLEELANSIIYLLDGRIQFQKEIKVLLEETGTNRLGKAIAQVMSDNYAEVEGVIKQP